MEKYIRMGITVLKIVLWGRKSIYLLNSPNDNFEDSYPLSALPFASN